ncbi:MAG: metalloregulator ArsR/SmtB family transcription factor [Clostridiales bacterium]|nr:metalloregulator ArsR/SmtB family transcription factor [Clostridiales bacterium]
MSNCTVNQAALIDDFRSFLKVFSALGDENRQLIFLTLMAGGQEGMRVPDITARVHLSRPAVSRHLKIMKEAGLINCHREGTRNYYYVDANESCWHQLREFVDQIDDMAAQAAASGYPYFSRAEDDLPTD